MGDKNSAIVHPLPTWGSLTDAQKLRWRRWAIEKITNEQPDKVQTGANGDTFINDDIVEARAKKLFEESLPKGGRRRKTRRRRHRRRTRRHCR